MGKISALGIDLAKTSFHIYGVDERGKCLFNKALNREKFELYIANLPPCTIFMEACGSAHYWAGRMASYGHTPRLIAPQFVKPFVKTNKNDGADAEAIVEAGSRPSMRFVPIKTFADLDLQAIHRVRSRLVRQRTALVNEARAILFEQGITIALGINTVRVFAQALLRGETKESVTPMCRETIADLMSELNDLDDRISVTDKRLEKYAKEHAVCQRLMTIPGIGLLTATALIAATPDPGAFKNGRQFSAWLGLVPRHTGTGGANKNRLGGISKRGDSYLRCLLVHGSRAVLRNIDKRSDPGAERLKELKTKKGWNKTAVALANKNARIAWVLLTRDEEFSFTKMSKAS